MYQVSAKQQIQQMQQTLRQLGQAEQQNAQKLQQISQHESNVQKTAAGRTRAPRPISLPAIILDTSKQVMKTAVRIMNFRSKDHITSCFLLSRVSATCWNYYSLLFRLSKPRFSSIFFRTSRQ